MTVERHTPDGTFDTRSPRVPPPELDQTGREMFENTRPVAYADTETDYSWARFTSALSELLDPIAEITRPLDGSESWTTLASPHRVPKAWLRVLAQWAGVRRPDAMDEEALRELIAEGGPGFWRGTRAALTAAVRRFLPPGTADQWLYFEERAVVTGDPNIDAYALRIFTYEMHTPPEVEAQIRDALQHAKPAGLYPFIYEVRRGQSWRMLRDRMEDWAEVNAHYENWREVLTDEPTGMGD
ncbi:MAG: phage tail protein [Thermoplasmata archaeon]|nr:phage tail protein [Thermoplasmata archaeon]